MIENDQDYRQALQYISSLDSAEAESNMRTYGSVLIQNVPQDFTESLKSLIVNWLQGGAAIRAEDYVHLFVNDHKAMVDFLEHLLSSTSEAGGGAAVRRQKRSSIFVSFTGTQSVRSAGLGTAIIRLLCICFLIFVFSHLQRLILHWSPLIKSAFCTRKIERIQGLTF